MSESAWAAVGRLLREKRRRGGRNVDSPDILRRELTVKRCRPYAVLTYYHLLAQELPEAVARLDPDVVRALVQGCGCSRDGPQRPQGDPARYEETPRELAAQVRRVQGAATATPDDREGLLAQRNLLAARRATAGVAACDYAEVLAGMRGLVWDRDQVSQEMEAALFSLFKGTLDHVSERMVQECACREKPPRGRP